MGLRSIAILAASGAIPSRVANPALNPWGQDYGVVGAGETFAVLVGVPNQAICDAFQVLFQNRATIVCPSTYPGSVSLASGEEAARNQTFTVGVAPQPAGGTITGSFNCGDGGVACSVTSFLGASYLLTATPSPNYQQPVQLPVA